MEISNYIGPAATSEDDTVYLTIEDLNLKGLPFAEDLRDRLEQIGKMADADVVTFQEVFSSSARKEVQNIPGFPYFSLPRYKGKLMSSGLATASRYKINGTHSESYKKAAGPDFFAAKGAQQIEINLPQLGRTHIFNTHLQASYKSQNQYKNVRNHQIKQLLRFIREHQDTDDALVLCGDFNMTPDSEEYKLIHDSGFEWIDIMQALHPNDELHTFRSANQYVCGKQDESCQGIADVRLDYIFVKPPKGYQINLEKSSGEILEDFEGVVLSDHDRQRVRIAFEKESLFPQLADEQMLSDIRVN